MSSFYLDQTFVISDNLAPVFFLLRVLQKYFLVLCFMSLFNLRMQTYLSKCRVSAGQFNIFGQIVCASRSYLQNRPLWNVNSVERGRNARRLKRQRVSNTSSLLHFGFTNIFYVLKKVCLRDTISWRKKNCFLNLCHSTFCSRTSSENLEKPFHFFQNSGTHFFIKKFDVLIIFLMETVYMYSDINRFEKINNSLPWCPWTKDSDNSLKRDHRLQSMFEVGLENLAAVFVTEKQFPLLYFNQFCSVIFFWYFKIMH